MTFASSILLVFHICSWVCNFHIQLSFRIVLFYTSPLTSLNSVSRIFWLQSFPQDQQRLPQDYIMPQLLPLQLLLFSFLEVLIPRALGHRSNKFLGHESLSQNGLSKKANPQKGFRMNKNTYKIIDT